MLCPFFFYYYAHHRHLHSFPTRRSSDLLHRHFLAAGARSPAAWRPRNQRRGDEPAARLRLADRKSTRLNSSHTVISYAVFCLKKKRSTHKAGGEDVLEH